MGFVCNSTPRAGADVEGVKTGVEVSGITDKGTTGDDAAYEKRKEDSARGSGVSIGIIGVGRDWDDPNFSGFSFVPLGCVEEILVRDGCSSRRSISQGEAIFDCSRVGSVAIAGVRWSGRLSNDDG